MRSADQGARQREGASMRQAMRLLIIMVLCGAVLSAQGAAKQSIEGVWKVSEIVVTGAGASAISSPQPGLFIFTRGHYSIMYVPGNKTRALKRAEAATTDEKVAAFDSFLANSGTYELAASTLTIRPIVARDPNYMVGGFNKYQFRIEGKTLT